MTAAVDQPEPSLEVVRLSVRYGQRWALRSVSVRVAEGEVVALAGPNGSGKSSLIRAVATALPASGGEVRVRGHRLQGLSALERAREVTWMPQEESLGDNVSLADYVEYGQYARHSRWRPPSESDRAGVRAALRTVDLEALAARGVLELSGGERQRARLARALAQDTPLLLLDEPTAHLDVSHQLEVLERIREYARSTRRAVLLALHDLNLAARFADRVAVLSRGRLRTVGPPAEVLSPELLSEVWGVVAELRRDPASGLPYLIPRLPGPAAPEREGPLRSFRLHVVAGGGSGGPIYRAAVDRGWEVSTGVLPLFDSDSEVAAELGLTAAVEVPFAPIGGEALDRLDQLLGPAQAIVVAPFPVGPTNLANLEHLLAWVERRPVLLIDLPPGAPWDYTGGRAETVRGRLVAEGATCVPDVASAIRWLDERSVTTAGHGTGRS